MSWQWQIEMYGSLIDRHREIDDIDHDKFNQKPRTTGLLTSIQNVTDYNGQQVSDKLRGSEYMGCAVHDCTAFVLILPSTKTVHDIVQNESFERIRCSTGNKGVNDDD